MPQRQTLVIVLTLVAASCNDPQPITTPAQDAQASSPLDAAGDRLVAAGDRAAMVDAGGADLAPAADAGAPPADAAVPDQAGAEARVASDAAPDRADTAVLPPGCGEVNQPCCPGQRCKGDDRVCVGGEDGHCARCGLSTSSERAPCCAGNRCAAGGCCVHVVSDSVSAFCVSAGDVCWELGSACAASGSCGPGCGGKGQPCCEGLKNVYCSEIGTTCTHAVPSPEATCVACGGAGQPCCQPIDSGFSIPGCIGELVCKATPAGKRCTP